MACIGAIRVFVTVRSPWSYIGIYIAWSQWLAGFFDMIENFVLINILFNNINEMLPLVAKWCAILKMILIILGLTYIIIAGVMGIKYFGTQKNYF